MTSPHGTQRLVLRAITQPTGWRATKINFTDPDREGRNQSSHEIPTVERGQNPTLMTPNAREDVETQGPSLLASGKAKWRSLLQETVWCLVVTHKTKHTLATLTSNHVHPKEWSTFVRTETCPWLSTAALFRTARMWEPPRWPSGVRGQRIRGPARQGSITPRQQDSHDPVTKRCVEEPERVSPSERSQCERLHPI